MYLWYSKVTATLQHLEPHLKTCHNNKIISKWKVELTGLMEENNNGLLISLRSLDFESF